MRSEPNDRTCQVCDLSYVAARGHLCVTEAQQVIVEAIDAAKRKHGERTIDVGKSNGRRLAILMEEVGEVARELQNIEDAMHDGMPGAAAVYRRDLQRELAQVAACATLWLARLLADERADHD